MKAEWFEIPRYWPLVAEWVARALEKGGSVGHWPEDVYRACLTDAMTLWLAMDKGARACAITEVRQYPRTRVCQMFVLAGMGADEWLERFEPDIEAWAKGRGCRYIEGAGRKGWVKRAPNYTVAYTILRRDLEA